MLGFGRCAWAATDRLRIYLGRSATLAPGTTLRLRPIRCRGGVSAPFRSFFFNSSNSCILITHTLYMVVWKTAVLSCKWEEMLGRISTNLHDMSGFIVHVDAAAKQ